MAKAKGQPHPDKALTAVGVKNAKPGRHADGGGLYLEVDATGARRWLLRVTVRGRRRDFGLGSARDVTLAEAREAATQWRRIARAGGDPSLERRRAKVPTFQDAARECHRERLPGWQNAKHGAQWLTTLEQYAFPKIGKAPVDQIGTGEVRDVLLPIWTTKAETARRVRQRIGVVLDWAATKGFRSGENPVHSVTKGLPPQKRETENFAALPYPEMPGFIAKLRECGASEPVRLAFEFLILTASRTSEALGARWSEVDLEAATWTVPKERMKAKRPHTVPLAPRALAILARARELSSGQGEGFIFESRPGKPYSNMVFLMTLRRMGVDTTAHGFRSTFRDWAAERTSTPREVAEAALAHTVENKVEAAYRRSDLLEKRRRLMEQWAQHCEGEGEGATVVALRRAVGAS